MYIGLSSGWSYLQTLEMLDTSTGVVSVIALVAFCTAAFGIIAQQLVQWSAQ
jgi:hypothetical protein